MVESQEISHQSQNSSKEQNTKLDTDSKYLRSLVLLKRLAAERQLTSFQGRPLLERIGKTREKLFGALPNIKGADPLAIREGRVYAGSLDHGNYFEYPLAVDAKQLTEEMGKMIDILYQQFKPDSSERNSLTKEEALRFASVVYCLGILIHPFIDGNGRTWSLTALSYLWEMYPLFKDLVLPYDRHPTTQKLELKIQRKVVGQPTYALVVDEFSKLLDERGVVTLYSQLLQLTRIQDKQPTNLFLSSLSDEELQQAIQLNTSKVSDYLSEHKEYLLEVGSLRKKNWGPEITRLLKEYEEQGMWSEESTKNIMKILRETTQNSDEFILEEIDQIKDNLEFMLGKQAADLLFDHFNPPRYEDQRERLKSFLSTLLSQPNSNELLFRYVSTGEFLTPQQANEDVPLLATTKLAKYVFDDFSRQLLEGLQTREERSNRVKNLGLKIRHTMTGSNLIRSPILKAMSDS